MRSYRETFRRHRLLYLLPPMLLVLAVGAISYTAPKSYESTASLWVDNQASSSSSLDVGPTNVQAVQPATAEQTLLDELLPTSKFDAAVVAGAGLGPAAAGASKASLEQSISSGVSSLAAGPQLLQVTYKASSPAVAQAIVKSLLTQLQSFTLAFSRQFGRSAIAYNQTQVVSSVRAVAGAKATLNVYQANHPRATTQNDQTYASLVSALATATSALSSTRTALNQAEAQANGSVSGTTVQVLDAPSYQPAPLSGLKSMLIKVVGAGLAGLLLSILAIVALTPSVDDVWDGELAETDDARGTQPPVRPVPRAGDPVPVRSQAAIPRPASSRTDRQWSVRPLARGRDRLSLPGPADDGDSGQQQAAERRA